MPIFLKKQIAKAKEHNDLTTRKGRQRHRQEMLDTGKHLHYTSVMFREMEQKEVDAFVQTQSEIVSKDCHDDLRTLLGAYYLYFSSVELRGILDAWILRKPYYTSIYNAWYDELIPTD